MTADANTQLPMGLQNEICGAFKCTICHIVPIKPPVITAKCCKSIIGCEECINSWYDGEDGLTKTCPLCRTDRGFTETMRFNGIERFIKAITDRFARPSKRKGKQLRTCSSCQYNLKTVTVDFKQLLICPI